MRGNDLVFVRDSEGGEQLRRVTHGVPIGLAAHDYPSEWLGHNVGQVVNLRPVAHRPLGLWDTRPGRLTTGRRIPSCPTVAIITALAPTCSRPCHRSCAD